MTILFLKTDQMHLFEKLVQVKGGHRADGSYIAPHTAIRHVAHHAPAAMQAAAKPDLFEPEAAKPEAPAQVEAAEPSRSEPETKPAPEPTVEAKAAPPKETKPKPAAEKPEVPKDGDRKTEDGVEYVLRGGRWHCAFDAAEDRQDLAEAMAKDPHSDKARQLIVKASKHEDAEPQEVADDLDPSSPNYRYRDTGYVGGSRKEMASLMIRRMARSGETVRVTDVDWESLEENPREAKELITKQNLFGSTDWAALEASGMDAGAGFLLSKVYGAVSTSPADDTAEGRRDYSLALTTLRDRLEPVKTAEGMIQAIEDIAAERDGVLLNESESGAYAAVQARMRAAMEGVRAIQAGEKVLAERHQAAIVAHHAADWEIKKRERKKWKVEDSHKAALDSARAEQETAAAALIAYQDANGMMPIRHETKLSNGVSLRLEYPFRAEVDKAADELKAIKLTATLRNQLENPLTRAWRALGEPFNAVTHYRSYKGSEAFAKHVATVKGGRVKDWSWAHQKREPRGATKQSTTFQLLVADNIEREGGRPIPADSTGGLKDAFDLREVQSGNWVLDDPNSAKFHVEACAGAFADLADLLEVDDAKVSFNGRLAMAFGARGKGGKGAAAAHYEPVQRVINMTKMAGAGSLAHEWFHMVDNLVKEAMTGVPSAADDFATITPAIVDDPKLHAAFRNLSEAMTSGKHRNVEHLVYTEHEEQWAAHNMAYGYTGGIKAKVKNAASLQAAVDAVEDAYSKGNFGAPDKRKSKTARDSWRKIALITHGGNPERRIEYETGPGMSAYMLDSMNLDEGEAGKYWSATHEMGARAFSSFIEDKLHGAGRKNTYLVDRSNNAAYRAMGSTSRPFPEAEERERINAAFEQLFEAIKSEDVLAKALALFDEEPLAS